MHIRVLVFLILLIIWSGLANDIHAQNLIPDPGFEDWDGTVGNAPTTMGPLTFWYNANSTPDHHHEDNPAGNNLTSLQPCPTGNGNTACGMAHSGKGVLGCYKGNGPNGVVEWAGTQLIEPLVPGACYKVSYWVQNKKDDPASLMLTNQWGVFFSKTMLPGFNPDGLDFSTVPDQWLTCQEVNDGSEWTYVEFAYSPQDAYTNVYVGYVGNVSTSTFTSWSNDTQIGFYAWFDDIMVERMDPTLTTSNDQTLCLGDSVLLTANSNYPVEWSDGITTDTLDAIWVKPTSTTTYTARTLGDPNCSLSKQIIVTVIGNTIKPFSESACAGTTPFLLNDVAGAGTWIGPGITQSNNGLFDAALAGEGIHLIQFKPDGDCALGYQVQIEVFPAPIIDFTVDEPIGCPRHTLQFFDQSNPPALSVLWNFGDTSTGDTFNDPIKVYFESGWYDVTLDVYYSKYCQASVTKDSFVHILDPPKADFSFSPSGPSNLDPTVQFTSATTGDPQSWFWNFSDGGINNSTDPTHTFSDVGVYPVTLVVTGAEGCADSLTKEVIVRWDVKLFVPTAFSPNKDGVNDVFRPSIIGPVDTFRMQIFDRWGNLLFQSTDPAIGWEGEARSGKRLDEGIYIYTLEVAPPMIGNSTSPVKRYSGEITLIR